jgi:hypothetical protein
LLSVASTAAQAYGIGKPGYLQPPLLSSQISIAAIPSRHDREDENICGLLVEVFWPTSRRRQAVSDQDDSSLRMVWRKRHDASQIAHSEVIRRWRKQLISLSISKPAPTPDCKRNRDLRK